jgi:hypothetical protein
MPYALCPMPYAFVLALAVGISFPNPPFDES